MIVFDLSCRAGHRFEGWFGSSDDFASQQDRGLLSCPECGDAQVTKAPMAPAVPVKGNARSTALTVPRAPAAPPETEAQPVSNVELPPAVTKALTALANAQAKALEKSTWVGKSFADKSRAMHYGEQANTLIHGEATPEQAQDLLDEGIAVAPLPFPVAPPEDLN